MSKIKSKKNHKNPAPLFYLELENLVDLPEPALRPGDRVVIFINSLYYGLSESICVRGSLKFNKNTKTFSIYRKNETLLVFTFDQIKVLSYKPGETSLLKVSFA
jgi:hypothetical protein